MTLFLSLDFTIFNSAGNKLKHRVEIHNITPVTGKERGDLEIKDYVVMQKPQPQDNRLPYSDRGLYHDAY